MGIVNRRNALLGWLAWQGAKMVLKRKAMAAMPSVDPQTKRPNKGAILAVLAVVAGAVFFWRSWGGDDEPGPA
jgi:hypothetical protein